MSYLYNDQSLKIVRRSLRDNMPDPEQKLWYYLRNKILKGYKFRRQFSIGNSVVDFFCPKIKLAIEVDGDSHFLDANTKAFDKRREELLAKHQINILRFTNDEVMNNIEAVVDKILAYLP